MKKFFAALLGFVMILTCTFGGTALAGSRISYAEEYSAVGTVTYRVVKKTTAVDADGNSITVFPQQDFTAKRIYVSKGGTWVYGKVLSGTSCYIKASALRTLAGKKLPSLQRKITLKKAITAAPIMISLFLSKCVIHCNTTITGSKNITKSASASIAFTQTMLYACAQFA